MGKDHDRDALLTAMRQPSFYPHPAEEVELRETAISWVFLAGARVYKVKKPVVRPFLDYGSLERRRRMCEEEVRLNRRLAPDVYLAVRPIVQAGRRFSLAEPGETHGAVEFAVEMRRLPLDRTMASLLEAGELTEHQVRSVGERLAAFHAEAEPVPLEEAGITAVARTVADNFETLLSLAGVIRDRRGLAAAQRFATAFLTARNEQLADRAAGGRVRDGHGDLRLEHVVLDRAIQVFDCIEFDPALRRIDVGADLAFLVMELHAGGAEEFADALVRAYRLAGGDPGDHALLAFYASYRALVRAKLHFLDAAKLPETDPELRPALARGRALLDLAERFAWRARLPLVLVVCGVTASGKSTLAQAVAGGARIPYLGSDLTRKRLAGVLPTQPAPPEAYRDEFNLRTYATLGRLAREALEREGGATVDATFRRRPEREAFREGFGDDLDATSFVQCVAPAPVLAERAAGREPDSPSDATVELVGVQLEEFAPLDEVAARRHMVVRTDRPLGEVIDDLEALLDSRLGDPSAGV